MDDSATVKPVPARLPGAATATSVLPSTISLKQASTIAEIRTKAVQAAQQPGVSMAAVAMAHGINANLLRRWVHEMARPPIDAAAVSANPVGFIALPMPASPAPPAPSAEPIRIEVRRGSTTIAVTWPTGAGDACAAWMRELLR